MLLPRALSYSTNTSIDDGTPGSQLSTRLHVDYMYERALQVAVRARPQLVQRSTRQVYPRIMSLRPSKHACTGDFALTM